MSLNDLNSSAFPEGSVKNIVACSPTSPSKRIFGSIRNSILAPRYRQLMPIVQPRITPKWLAGTCLHRLGWLAHRLSHLRDARRPDVRKSKSIHRSDVVRPATKDIMEIFGCLRSETGMLDERCASHSYLVLSLLHRYGDIIIMGIFDLILQGHKAS